MKKGVTMDESTQDGLSQIAKAKGYRSIPDLLRGIVRDATEKGLIKIVNVAAPHISEFHSAGAVEDATSPVPIQQGSNPPAPTPVPDEKKEGDSDADRKDPEIFGIESYR